MPKDSVPIILRGEKHDFRFNFNSLCAMEEEFGITLADFGKIFGSPEEGGGLSLKNLRILVWAALLHEREDLKPRDAGELIDPRSLVELSQKIAEAMLLALPAIEVGDEGKNAERPKSQRNGAGGST